MAALATALHSNSSPNGRFGVLARRWAFSQAWPRPRFSSHDRSRQARLDRPPRRLRRVGLDVLRDQDRGRDDPAAPRRRVAVPRGGAPPGGAARLAWHVVAGHARRARGERDRRRAPARARRRAGARRGDAHRLEHRGDDRRNGPAADHRTAPDRAGEPCASDAPQHARRPRRPPARRRTRPRRGIDCARTRRDDLRHDLLVDGLVPVEAPRAPARSVRRDRLGDGTRRHLPDGRRARVRRVRRPRLGHVRARLGSRLGLPRDHGIGRRLLGVRVAPEGRADLARRHAPVREPAGRDRARDGVPRRAAEPVGTRRSRTRDRAVYVAIRAEFPRKTRPASVVPRGTPADQTV